MKSLLVVGLGFFGIALLGCGGGGNGDQGGNQGGTASLCDEFRDEASPGNVVFRVTNKRATPIYYDDNGECSRAFRVGEGDAEPISPSLTGSPSCGWYMDNTDQGPLDCLTSEHKTLGPNESVDLAWDGRVIEPHELPDACVAHRDFTPTCDKLVALDAGTLTVHLTFAADEHCTEGFCGGINPEVKKQTFTFPAAGPVDIAIE
ncbi:hypothetical protein [Polyangium aurulentum]|uniref:hypothetical protein n=1 Tax=Polyangium aurulentum TaxID=2567896 RepID=UPI0010AEBDFA|nr:hypothetical protein [Polyangium aurulentum]UQA62813.1 hypothetical protein E8A73_021120 [Polyangium aurulentum]